MIKYIGILALFISVSTFAQDLETDRPDQTESSAVVPKGTFQIETGMGIELTSFSTVSFDYTERSFVLPTSLFRIALSNKFELRIVNTLRNNRNEATFFGTEDKWQIDDLQVGFKWQIADGDGAKPQFSFMSHVLIPLGSEENINYGTINKILISHDFKNGCGLGYNIGYNYFGNANGDLTYSIAMGFPITERIGSYIEMYGEYANFTDFTANADAGITYLLKDNIQLDYSFGIGITNRMNYQAVGLSIRLPK